MSRILLVVSLSLLMLAACSNGDDELRTTSTDTTSNPSATPTQTVVPTATVSATSGIEGQVLLGPTCPVERQGMPCEEPYKATIVVWDAARSQRVLVFDSDDEGRFREGLLPGEYYIEPQGDQQGLPRPEPQTVMVPANTFVSLTLRYDTGIR